MSAETIRWLLLAASFLLTLFVWFRLIRLKEHPALKVVIALLALIPVLGPLIGLWLTGMPDVQPRRFRATMNHWGIGGRFIGFGSGRFTYSGQPGEGKDWNPSVPERIKRRKRIKRQ